MKLRLSFMMAFAFIFTSMLATVHNVAVTSNFNPSSLAINAGDTVVWTNTNTSGSHNVNGTLATFPSNPTGFGNAVGAVWNYQFIFNVPGTYNYQCDVHAATMQGTIVVSPAPAVPCSKPYISEYIEGSSNNKGFEIYNPTGSSLDLGPYKVYMASNGNTTANASFDLTGSIASGEVYVITTSQADPQMLAEADTALSYPSVAHYNGDDALFLVDTASNDTIDIIGVIGVDPGSNWTVGTGATSEFTLVRNSNIEMGQTDWSIGANEWDVYPQNTYSYLGSHTSTCVAPPVVSCSRPFFSEYIEGSSNSKGFEIYNPTNASLDLGPYQVYMASNGNATANASFNLSGTLATGDVYVITTDQADPVMLAQADTALAYPSVAHYNGDDALFLVDTTTNDTVDIIGVIGVDPGSSWTVGTGSTQDYTLIRTATVEGGQTDWSIGATEWDVHPQNTFSFLGSHSSTCVVPSNPSVDFSYVSRTYQESAGTVTFDILINPSASSAESIDLLFDLGAGIDLNDGSITPTPDLVTGLLTLPVAANEDTVSITFDIIDDAVLEGNETLFVDVVGLSAGLDSGSVVSTMIIIEDNDAVIPVYDIADVTTVDANNEPDSLGVECTLYGVVYTDDFDEDAGYSFYIYDNTGGINVYNFADVSGYQVQRGDSIRAIGEIGFYNGLIQLTVDSIELISSGNSLKRPDVESVLDESTEGEYIRMNGWTLADVTQWTTGTGNGGFNVDITNGTDTFVMRIDEATELYHMAAPTTGTFDVIGAGSQFDNSSPYDEGYQIFPRDSADIITNISLAEVPKINVSLYPNPAKDVVYVQAEDNQPKNIQVFTVTGQMVRSLESADTKVAVDLKGLPAGSYILAIEIDGRMASHKVILK